jgi:hypothetical protein
MNGRYVCTESYRPTKEPQYLELHKGVTLNHPRTGKEKGNEMCALS